MSLFENALRSGRQWSRVGDYYTVTKKPRGIDLSAIPAIPFTAMEAIPQDGSYFAHFKMRATGSFNGGTYFERGDILLAKITPSFENGKQSLMTNLPTQFGFATTEVIPIKILSIKHDPRLLFFYLLHPDVRHFLGERMEGSTGRKRVPESALLDLPIPVLELSEQVAVADVLELIRLASSSEAKSEQIGQTLKRAAMHTLFTQGLRGEALKETEIGPMPQSWEVVPLGSLGHVGNGSTPKKSVREYWEGGNFPWLTSAKVYDRDIVAADQHVTATALKECHLPIIEPGAIVIAITGQGKTLGHCAVLCLRATVNQHIAYLATDLERASPSFIRGYLETQYDHLRQVGAGGGSTKGALTCGFLRSMPIPLPPTLDEQHEIVAILDAIDRKIDLHRRKRAVLDELFKALLHKLMTGEIRVADLDLSALEPKPAPEAAA